MTSLFFLSCAMCAQAETVSSQSIRITLNKNNVRLENILNDIESQTNLLFIYNKNVNVNRKVSVNAQNTSLQEVLQNLVELFAVEFDPAATHQRQTFAFFADLTPFFFAWASVTGIVAADEAVPSAVK